MAVPIFDLMLFVQVHCCCQLRRFSVGAYREYRSWAARNEMDNASQVACAAVLEVFAP
jgi:hypothetical protein